MTTEKRMFANSFKAGAMLVKSIQTGEVKTLDIDDRLVLRNPIALDAFEVRDAKVVPKHNFTKADPGMVNIHAHKGPDEPKQPIDGGIAL